MDPQKQDELVEQFLASCAASDSKANEPDTAAKIRALARTILKHTGDTSLLPVSRDNMVAFFRTIIVADKGAEKFLESIGRIGTFDHVSELEKAGFVVEAWLTDVKLRPPLVAQHYVGLMKETNPQTTWDVLCHCLQIIF